MTLGSLIKLIIVCKLNKVLDMHWYIDYSEPIQIFGSEIRKNIKWIRTHYAVGSSNNIIVTVHISIW